MQKYLYVDFETRSMCDLKTRGVVNYAKDPTTSIIVMSYAIGDKKGKGEIKSVPYPKSFAKLPAEIRNFKGRIIAHNTSFENQLFINVLKCNKYFADPANYDDIMALAFRNSLPGSLDQLGLILGLGGKVQVGKGLIAKYSKPQKGVLIPIPPEDEKAFRKYCEADIRLTQKVHAKLPDLEPREEKLYRIDQRMNFEGIALDLQVLKRLQYAYDIYTDKAEKAAEKLAGRMDSGTLTITSNVGFKRYLATLGYQIENAQAETLEAILEEDRISKKVREAIHLRLTLNAKAPKKILTMLQLQNGGRLYYFLQYYGAHTGRWAGRGAQLQNFPRTKIKNKEYEKLLRELQKGKITLENYTDEISKLLRGTIIPSKGKEFFIGDLSAIEPRVTFWVSGCKGGIKDFQLQDKDPKIPDIYVKFASRLSLSHIKDPKERRQVGKVSILGLGYGMGKVKFQKELKKYKVKNATYTLSESIVRIYRRTYKEVELAWKGLEKAFAEAYNKGHGQFREIKFYREKDYIKVMLPSGRELRYFKPTENTYIHGSQGRKKIWGGVILENIVQAISRDILVEMIFALEKKSTTNLVLTEHDSNIVEVPKNKAKIADFKKIMSTPPEWIHGLPLAAECFVSSRFGK